MQIMQKSSNAQDRPLSVWYDRIKQCQIKLPRFQRFEAWDRGRIASFLNTIIYNLPIGVTLVLKVGDEEKFISRFISTAEIDNNENVTEYLLDGQQRLTALWRSLNNNYEDETYFVYLPEFDNYEDGILSENMFVYCRPRYIYKDQRYPLWADNPMKCIQRGFIPFDLLSPEDNIKKIDSWIKSAIAHLEPNSDDPSYSTKKEYGESITKYNEIVQKLRDRINDLRQTIGLFNLPYLALPANTPKEVALQVFINMNTNSKPLSLYDIIVAEVESLEGVSLHDLLDNLEYDYPLVKNYSDLSFLVLATSALMQDKLPSQRGMIVMEKETMISRWKELTKALGNMAEFLINQKIFDKQRLPTNAVLAVIAASYVLIPETGDVRGVGELLLKKYLWSSFFTDRYENSAASRAYADYIGIKRVLTNSKKDNGLPYTENDIPVLNREEHEVTNIEELLTVGWPQQENIRGRGLLAVASQFNALDFADGKPLTKESIATRQYHHIFPDALLKEAEINSHLALNCALITWKTNLSIGRKEPLIYIQERSNWSDKEIVYDRLNSHLIPVKELANGGYEGLDDTEKRNKIRDDFSLFIKARGRLMTTAIRLLVQGKDITFSNILNSDNN